jgi:hypothetical protein
VVDVPAKLTRLFDTGRNRKTDAHDAHAVAVVAVRTSGLRVLGYDDELEALRMLVDRRDELTRTRVQTVNRLHRCASRDQHPSGHVSVVLPKGSLAGEVGVDRGGLDVPVRVVGP